VGIEWGIPENIHTIPWTASIVEPPLSVRISKMCYPLMPPDFQFKDPRPLGLGIPKSRSWFGMDIFWNCPIYHAFPLPPSSYCLELLYHCSRKSSNKIEKSNQRALCFATQSTTSLKK